MVTRFFTTPRVRITFDDRLYHLGESIDVTVTLAASNEIHHIRSGEVELVATVKYSETIVSSEFPRAGGGTPSSYYSVPRPRTLRTTSQFEEEYTLAAVNFVTDEMSISDDMEFTAKVPVTDDPPPNWQRGTTNHRLIVLMDLAGEKDVHAERDVRVSILPKA